MRRDGESELKLNAWAGWFRIFAGVKFGCGWMKPKCVVAGWYVPLSI